MMRRSVTPAFRPWRALLALLLLLAGQTSSVWAAAGYECRRDHGALASVTPRSGIAAGLPVAAAVGEDHAHPPADAADGLDASRGTCAVDSGLAAEVLHAPLAPAASARAPAALVAALTRIAGRPPAPPPRSTQGTA